MSRTVVTSACLAALLGVALVLALAGPASVATGTVGAQATNETNVTHHENPAIVDGSGDSDRVRDWLSGRLTDRLRESSIRLSEEEYELAEGVVGDEFQERLNQYVEVAGETDGEDDAEDTGNEFERARENQRALASGTREYEETYEEYQEAREEGNTTRARRHAREMERLTREIQRRGENATQSLMALENRTGEETDDIVRRVTNDTQTIVSQQEEVRTEAFVETSLQVTTNGTVASFTDPAEVSGRLRAVNGSVVTNRPVRLQVGEMAYRTRTDADGRFTVTYRPVLIRADTETLPVQFLPRLTAPYLGSEATTPLEIRQVEPSLSTTVRPDGAGFGENVTVTASLSAGGRSISSVPISTSLGGRSLGQSGTDGDGTAQVTRELPVRVPAGEATVRSAVALDNRAIGPADATTSLTIRETATALTVEGEVTGEEFVVTGQLVARPGGDAVEVSGQSVEVSLAGTVQTVETGPDGNYEVRLARSANDSPGAGESVTIRAQFDGGGTNLESSAAETRLTVPGSSGGNLVSVPALVVAGAILALVLAGAILARRRWRPERGAGTGEANEGESKVGEPSVRGPTQAERWVQRASEALTDGSTEEVVADAYAAVRGYLSEQYGIDSALTPREVLGLSEDYLDTESQASLETLTDIYERTAFAPETVEDGGSRAVELARSLLDERSGDVADD